MLIEMIGLIREVAALFSSELLHPLVLCPGDRLKRREKESRLTGQLIYVEGFFTCEHHVCFCNRFFLI